jgi:four helix bundle protein
VPLNIGEGSRRRGKDRLHSYRIAAGSADEVRVALLTACAWGDLGESDIAAALALADRELAILWRLAESPAR